MEKIDCAMYINATMCAGLTEKKCDGCRFYKTQERIDEENERAMRICKEKGITTYDYYFKKLLKRKDDDYEKGKDESGAILQN